MLASKLELVSSVDAGGDGGGKTASASASDLARVLRRFPDGRPLFMLVSDLDHTMVS